MDSSKRRLRVVLAWAVLLLAYAGYSNFQLRRDVAHSRTFISSCFTGIPFNSPAGEVVRCKLELDAPDQPKGKK